MSKDKAVLGTLVGLAAGTIVGILLAPEKGSATRKQIVGKSDDYMHQLNSKFNELSHSIAEKFDNTKKDAEFLAGKSKAKFENFKKDAKNAASDVEHSES